MYMICIYYIVNPALTFVPTVYSIIIDTTNLKIQVKQNARFEGILMLFNILCICKFSKKNMRIDVYFSLEEL